MAADWIKIRAMKNAPEITAKPVKTERKPRGMVRGSDGTDWRVKPVAERS